MNCKNCKNTLGIDTKFCDDCGAKVVQERITLKKLRQDIFTNYLGWDNKFIFTTKNLILRPGKTIQEYLGGTRKKYMNPIGYYGLIITVSFLFFSQFEDNFVAMNSLGAESTTLDSAYELGYETSGKELSDDKAAQVAMESFGNSMQKGTKALLKYFNIFSFVLLPFYGFLAYVVYGKKYNYGEHLVIGTYIQAVLGIFSFLVFILVFFLTPKINILTFLLTIIYYLFVYQRLYEQNWKQVLLSFLKFIGVLILLFIIMGILIIVGVFAYKMLTKA